LPTNTYNNTVGNWDDDAFQAYGGDQRNGIYSFSDQMASKNGCAASCNCGPWWGSPYAGGFPMVMFDGSVHMMQYDSSVGYLTTVLTSMQGDIYTGPAF